MIAVGFWASWGYIALAVVGVILFWKVMDDAAEAFSQWHAARGLGEDLSANEERER